MELDSTALQANKSMEEEKKSTGFIIDETIIRVGGRELVCLVIACN